MSVYKLVIQGKPVIQKRARTFMRWGKVITWDPTGKERKALSLGLMEARIRAKMPVLESLLHVYASFYGCGNRCDLDNLLKALLDSGNKEVLWKDDKQIVQIHAFMYREDKDPRTEIEIVEIG